MDKKYKEAAHLIEATDELFEYFTDYIDNTPEIKELKQERDRLCTELQAMIMMDFDQADSVQFRDTLYEACFALDAIGENAVEGLRSWFCLN
jgi:type VI protein secretion system component VasK